MKFGVDRREATAASADAAAVGVFEVEGKDDRLPPSLALADKASAGLLAAAWKRREVKGKKRELTVLHRPDGRGRVVLIGLGAHAEFTTDTVRRAAADVVRGLRGKGARTLAFQLSSFVDGPVTSSLAARALTDGSILGAYEFLRYRTTTEGGIEEAAVYLGEDRVAEERSLTGEVAEETAIAENVLWTRDIANLPADTATPERLAEEARALGKALGLKVTVFDEKQLAKMGCGGIVAVGGGSVHPPRLIILEYPGGTRRGRTVAVVGKGITFDSGGLSLKPGPRMSEMKFDKSGAVAVLGILRAAATLKVAPRVIGVMCCAENLPSGAAYRPGDVIRTYNQKTIEVLNTDAEGRVVLADGLGYVVDQYKPDEVIDLATLTGAQVVALGDAMAGLVSTDDRLAGGLLLAAASTGEPLWRMPLTDYARELVKSELADVRNSTEIPPAGMLTAAAFLETFVGKTPWAHIDMAGPAWVNAVTRKYQPSYMSLGATGFGVRLVGRYLQDLGTSKG
jgi:leucyl aminopeptidase